ncbi:apoptosis-associated speck-like protein containing a CARD isoform X1 [Ochotona curzoniae]|uniref:apoptosis-associated speck-like protein containing a CARD isoform X1 n=1 Tax=Ochotona curzoniae TaxID=130825 RepID=UPI001B3476BC|nr:apoptosis-associated speck-like protein containing a CARD isoform X1 [Ochotona curzoniae]
MGSGREAILEALEDLTEEDFKKFKLKLLSVPLREGYGRIPGGRLRAQEKGCMDRLDLADKLVSFYLEEYGAELTATVLRDMGLQETARQLQERMQKCMQKGSAAAPARTKQAAKPALHFVDQHRAALIARVTHVDGVLDELHGKVLTEEQYQAVRAETTNPNKMRKLFSFAPAWDANCKELLLQALQEQQPYLVDDLQRS